ncbi:MAG: exosortase U [Planctomycetota bacterium]
MSATSPQVVETTTPLSTQERDWLRSPTTFWGLLFAASAIFLVPYFQAAWNQPHFQYIPLVPLVIAGFVWMRKDGFLDFPRHRTTLLLLFGVNFLWLIAAVLRSSWVGALGFILLMLAWLSSLIQRDRSSLLYLGIPLLTFIRLPFERTQALIVRLQMLTTELSSVLLDLFSVPHIIRGNTIELSSRQLFVDEACSGVRSLFTLFFAATVLMIYRKRSVYALPLMLAAGGLAAIFGNTIRVTVIAIAQDWSDVDLSTGWQHDMLGHGTLILSLALLFSADKLIGAFVHPIDADDASVDNPFLRIWNWFFRDSQTPPDIHPEDFAKLPSTSSTPDKPTLVAYGTFASIALLLAGLTGVGKWIEASNRGYRLVENELLFQVDDTFLKSVNEDLQLSDYRAHRDGTVDLTDRLGKNADIWSCSYASRPGELVISQPYVGWHELTFCYRGMGWTMDSREQIFVGENRAPVVMARFSREPYGQAFLFFSGVNADGSSPRNFGLSRFRRWLSPFYPTILDDPAEMTGIGQTAMIQYWCVTDKEMDDARMKEIAELIADTRDQMRPAT